MYLPAELWLHIMERVPCMGALFNFALTCKLFAELARDPKQRVAAKKRLARRVKLELTFGGFEIYYELANRTRHGPFRSFTNEGFERFYCEFADGLLDGEYRIYWCGPPGIAPRLYEEGTWKEGRREGFWRGWHWEGQLRDCVNYRAGSREGAYRSYYPTGFNREYRTYYGDKLHGLSLKWDSSGMLTLRCHFREGKLEGEYREFYHGNGVPHIWTSYKAGKRHGDYACWYRSGRPLAWCCYKDGNIEGESWRYFPNGTPEEHAYYKEGVLHGRRELWYANGEPMLVCDYVNGRRQGEQVTWDAGGYLTTHCFL